MPPYFLSWAILAGVLLAVFASDGPVNGFLGLFGAQPIQFLNSNSWFPGILIASRVEEHGDEHRHLPGRYHEH